MNESTLDQTCRTMEDIAKEAYAQGKREAQRERAMLLEACEEALWLTDGYEDVDDGSDGQPVPNVFMKIACVLREAIAKATKVAA